MHSQTGIVAGLASLIIIGFAADPAAADPGPLPLPAIDLTVNVLPRRSPTTAATEADPTTNPASAEPIKTQPATREQVVRTNGGGTAARKQTTATRSPKVPPLRPAAPEPPAVAAGPSGNTVDRWFDLAALAILALVVASFGRRRRKLCAADLVDRAACRPEFTDPEGVARRRLRSVR